ncbi:hypothetical protein ACXYTJ_15400 [Gilvimarinus sp. F26214L]|uniref:hypothetical protein n=1 Tax=Gilvimarinus sp. DZF01 TaxID=3461371 RepID=UPI00404612C3
MSINSWYFWAFGSLMIATFAAWLVFARFSMARIERFIERDGFPRPCQWDAPGARIVLYAYAIALPRGIAERLDMRLIDVPLVRHYASAADSYRALVFLISTHAFVLMVFV